MDASILRALLEKVLRLESQLNIQQHLERARDAVNNMASAPQEPSHQTAFADAFKNLKSSVRKMSKLLSPAEWDRLSEIASDYDYSSYLIEEIEEIVSENAATPAVIRDNLQEISENRAAAIQHHRTLLDELIYFGFKDTPNNIGEGQIGFKIPRDLFSNNFSNLINELNFLRKFVRLIAEAEGENPDDIEVGTISTSDPLFWLIVAYGVAKSVGSLTEWCLGIWKTVEDIRLVRAQTAKLTSFDADEIERIFAPKIQKQIDDAIEEKIAELTSSVTDKARKHELVNGLRTMLGQFLARIERGLTVDIQYLPPPPGENDPAEDEKERQSKMAEMHEVASKLVFPTPVGEPILKLNAANDDRPDTSTSPNT